MGSGSPDWTRRVVQVEVVNGVPVTAESGIGNISGNDLSIEDTNFTSADSPATHDIETLLGRVAYDGYIICDGAGALQYEISNDGTNWGGAHTLNQDEYVELTHRTISKIRITWVANSAYRICVV